MATPVTLPTSALTLVSTTLFLVRHADVGTGQDPHLTPAGKKRALELRHVLGAVGIVEIITTELQRTRETAQPLATLRGLTPTVIAAGPVGPLVQHINSGAPGRRILVVGHSDTVPEIVVAFGGAPVPPIPATQFDRLFVVTVTVLQGKTLNVAPVSVTIPERRLTSVQDLRYGA